MGVKRESKQDRVEKMLERYLKASRVEREKMLDGFSALTRYHRTYAQTLLRHSPSVLTGRWGSSDNSILR